MNGIAPGPLDGAAGRAGVFEDKRDRTASPFRAWAYLEEEGWELVTVLNEMGQHVAYFKRPVES